ncbi:MAG: FGGY-family carbohydrate kinase [Treponema sp.]|jgi:sugar (pentulose or hexulose) kinase|nr:FGGY-family carbohydrate kinase [Treponema sp.]
MSALETILTVDIGTSSLKTAFIGFDGRQKAFARETYSAHANMARQWETALFRGVQRLFEACPFEKPSAVCVSANGPSLVPVSVDGEIWEPLLWHDQKIINIKGQKSFFLPHAAFFAHDFSERYERTRFLFSAQEWLSFRMGADPVTVLPQNGYVEYYWDDEQCARFRVDRDKFPPFVNMGEIIGAVSKEAARRYGLPQGIPIVGAGPDFIMALIGVGAIEAGIVCDRAGTSEGINMCAERETAARAAGLRVLPHIRNGLWNIGGVIPRSGALFDDFLKKKAQSGDYGKILREIMRDKQSEGFSTLETMAREVKAVLETFAKNDIPIKEMRVSGGQGKSRLWNQMKADITGCVFVAPQITDGELAGDAALALTALRQTRDIEEAVSRLFRVKEIFHPHTG